MGLSSISQACLRRRAAIAAAAVVGSVLLAGPAARATPVPSVPFSDGKVLNVLAVVGSGSNSAYLAVDFTDGVDEAFQYNFTGPLNGYGLLTGVEAATTLRDVDTYYPSYSEHLVSSITDGANTTAQYPALYYSPPSAGGASAGTSGQGINYESSPVGLDQVAVSNGLIVAFDNSYTAVPTLPETSAVPEPATAVAAGLLATGAMLRRRAR